MQAKMLSKVSRGFKSASLFSNYSTFFCAVWALWYEKSGVNEGKIYVFAFRSLHWPRTVYIMISNCIHTHNFLTCCCCCWCSFFGLPKKAREKPIRSNNKTFVITSICIKYEYCRIFLPQRNSSSSSSYSSFSSSENARNESEKERAQKSVIFKLFHKRIRNSYIFTCLYVVLWGGGGGGWSFIGSHRFSSSFCLRCVFITATNENAKNHVRAEKTNVFQKFTCNLYIVCVLTLLSLSECVWFYFQKSLIGFGWKRKKMLLAHAKTRATIIWEFPMVAK